MRHFLFLILLGLLGACHRVDPDSVQGKRQAEMKQLLRLSETLSGMARGRQPFVAADFEKTAELLQAAARKPWRHFPEYMAVPPVDADAAKAFTKAAADFQAATAQLRIAASKGALDDVRVPLWKVEDSCNACHRVFRPQ